MASDNPVRAALTPEELKFCEVYAGFGEKNAPEAYRRSHLAKLRGAYYDPDWVVIEGGKVVGLVDSGDGPPAPVGPKDIQRRLKTLLAQEHVQDYLKVLRRSPGDAARAELGEQVRMAPTEQLRRSAAEKILADEDKLAFKSGVQRWAEILCEIGAEIVVPCKKHGEHAVPFSKMFGGTKNDG